ncbi:zinc finger MYM-type protein 1-like [Euwallacea similis]|uniref:zinc finger MYM-type protein 1-like n=1 Tax=Euwallacea similis TaxID=1736056 RepID=UPI00344FE55B
MSVVQLIKKLKSANELNPAGRVEFKANGRPVPELKIRQSSRDKDKEVHRNFRMSMYDLASWMCGCELTDSLYCFVCLLFTDDPLWCVTGVKDLKHLKERIRKHSLSADHMKCSIDYAMIDSADVRLQLDSAYRKSVTDFNELVSKNRYILNKMIDCVKFCGAFELALQENGEAYSGTPGAFRGLIDFVAELDPIFKEYMENSIILKGTSKPIQDELLDAMLMVAQEQIKREILSAKYVALHVEEVIDASDKALMAFIVRYVLSGTLHERFLKFVSPPGTSDQQIASMILQELENLEVNKCPEKLIGQSYDRASSSGGKLGGVQKRVREHYPSAKFIHCYASPISSIVQKAASQEKMVRVFFANLSGFSRFFDESPKRTATLKEFVEIRLLKASPANWSFHSGCMDIVFFYRKDIALCLERIIEVEKDPDTINQAICLSGFLQNEDFLYWLNFFHLIMPHCDILFNELQKRCIDVSSAKTFLDAFKSSIKAVRENTLRDSEQSFACENSNRRRKIEDTKRAAALEVCDLITVEITNRFGFCDHLVINQLFYSDQFVFYKNMFPDNILALIKKNFPSINHSKLKTELQVIYDREDFRVSSGAIPMLKLFMNNNLSETFSESVKLLTMLCTLPMTTTESERCFPTLKRVKTFLRNAMGQQKLSALALLSVEKSLINEMGDFNERVIQHFANLKMGQIDLKFKDI